MLAPDCGEVRGGRGWHRGCHLCGAGKGARRRLRLSSVPEAVALEAPSPPAFPSFFPGRSLAASFYPSHSFLLPDIRDCVVAPGDVLSTSQASLPPQAGAMASKLLGETQSGLNPALVLVMSKPMGRRGGGLRLVSPWSENSAPFLN